MTKAKREQPVTTAEIIQELIKIARKLRSR